MRYFELAMASKENGELIPGLDGSKVKGKDDFFKTKECGPNKFYDHEYEFDYLTPKAFGEPEPEAKVIADYHMWHGRKPRGGTFYPVSKAFKEVLERFNLAPSKFYKAKVLYRDELYPYFVWQILMNEYEQYIDFEYTEFNNLNQSRELGKEGLKIEKFKAISEVDDHAGKNWGFLWNYERLVLKPTFKGLDFCMFPMLHTIISESLKQAIEEAGLTGIAFKELPIPIEFSDEIK